MKIRYDNVLARISDYTPEQYAWLRELLTVEDRRYRPQPAHLKGKVKPAENAPYCIEAAGTFPAGLIRVVHAAAAAEKRHGIEFEALNQPPCGVDTSADTTWLRDYQAKALARIATRKRGLIKAPTGSGKTEMIIATTRVYSGAEWIMFVHRTDLVDQAAARYARRTGERAGTFTKGKWQRGTCNFTVSTFQSVAAALKKATRNAGEDDVLTLIDSIQGLLVDEVHAQPAESYYAVSERFSNAFYRFGFSGTPLDRDDVSNLRTMGCIGPIIHEVSTQELIEKGVLAKATVRMVKCRQPPSLSDCGWAEVYKDWIVRSDARNNLICNIAERAAKPCMLFVEEVEHGNAITQSLKAAGIKTDFVYGKDWGALRKEKLVSLASGQLDVLVCNVIFQEGIDVPELRSVVVASGKTSAVAALQRIGRGMRVDRATGKDTFEVWDVLDLGQHWLKKHAAARYDTYTKAGHEVQVGGISDADRL